MGDRWEVGNLSSLQTTSLKLSQPLMSWRMSLLYWHEAGRGTVRCPSTASVTFAYAFAGTLIS